MHVTAQQITAFTILGVTLFLFVHARWRYDVVAMFALLAVVLSGLVPARDAFVGFAHPAVITVAAVLVISRGLQNAGLVDAVVKAISPLRGRENLQLAAQCLVIAILSSFMNNVGALALMLPVALRNAYRDGYPPAKTLMPLAFASLLGGLTTLIGTPPNIIISTFRAERAGVPFGMFDFTPVGVAVALAGLAFLVLIGWRLIAIDRRGSDAGRAFEIEGYLTEAEVAPGDPVQPEVHPFDADVRVLLVVEIVQQPDQAPLIGIAAEPGRVSAHRRLDSQHVLDQALALCVLIEKRPGSGAGHRYFPSWALV